MSLIHKDLDKLKYYADRLGIPEMYGLFACMVSGRSWKAITSGIEQQFSEEEVGDDGLVILKKTNIKLGLIFIYEEF